MAQPNPYFGLTSAELATARSETLAAISSIKKAGQSYGVSGRSKSAAALSDLQQDLYWIGEATARAAGTRVTTTYADFSAA
jgi:hypothetical protein